MKISTSTQVLSDRFGEEEAVRILCKAGYEGIDFNMFSLSRSAFTPAWRESAYRLRVLADSFGVPFLQAHAPYPTMRWGESESQNEERIAAVMQAIRFAGLLGVSAIVVHPHASYPHTDEETQWHLNEKMYRRLLPIAKEAGVRIAVENMWRRENGRILPVVCSTGADFRRYMDRLCEIDDSFTACLDIGHCGLVGDSAPAMIRALGPHLSALHVHDNDFLSDRHTLPYCGQIEWDGVIDALRESGYSGAFNYEADGFLEPFPNEVLPACVSLMVKVAKYMRDRITQP